LCQPNAGHPVRRNTTAGAINSSPTGLSSASGAPSARGQDQGNPQASAMLNVPIHDAPTLRVPLDYNKFEATRIKYPVNNNFHRQFENISRALGQVYCLTSVQIMTF